MRARRADLIGLVGGMTWHSTARYYRLLNERSEALRGPRSTPESLIMTLDFAPLFQMALKDEWPAIADRLMGAVVTLAAGGAGLVALTAVTAHRVFASVAASTSLPCIHVLDPAGMLLQRRGIRRIGVLATRFTTSQDFIDARLGQAGVTGVLRPDAADQGVVDAIIEHQLARGVIRPAARRTIDDIADGLRRRGAEALLLACTELPLLYPDGDMPNDVVDAVTLHVDALLTHGGTP
ncbi:aspartate/glutamate racemase family protein [Bradyrhizobium cenepequi]|uniref:aspartate/glutamate racemase family protein n=1 Tax=Bradyrhizobium cenepequi TaxID=2821403 RepID=UPI001CE30C4A|nr:amino acid racemase [Bradyrhizobium cenepequi]MCA6107046.1 amino acid racemase [Bradyrhizobium cenepequi]